MPKLTLNRRTVLRGTIGGVAISVGLPPLEAMFNGNGTAYAQGAAGLPKRLGIFFWGNGVKLDRWVPSTTGAGWTPSPSLQPFAEAGVKDYVNVVTGMNIKSGNERGHHSGLTGIMSGAALTAQPHPNSNYVSTYTKPSIDQVAAAVIGQTTKFKSLEVGVSKKVVGGEGTTLKYLSHNGPDSFNPPEYNPRNVFNRLFGADFTPPASGTPTVVDATKALRKSVLDAVLADMTSLKGRVGTTDKLRLDSHMANIRTLENRLTPATPTLPPGSSACVRPGQPAAPPTSGAEPLVTTNKAMSELIAMALACDQTRVFSVMFTGSVGYTVFSDLGVTSGHHDLTHNEEGDQPQVQATTVYTMQQFATLLAALKAIPEGDGNLLDSCAILASSDTSDGKAHGINNYPILVAGKAGGKLKYPSVHYKSNGENTSMVLLSILRSVGLDLAQFGTGGGMVSTSCTAIEA
jgi:hypothetical protein